MNECNTHLGAFGCRFFLLVDWLVWWCCMNTTGLFWLYVAVDMGAIMNAVVRISGQRTEEARKLLEEG